MDVSERTPAPCFCEVNNREKLCADLGQRNIANLIQRDHVVAHPACQHPSHSVLLLGFYQITSAQRCHEIAEIPWKLG